MRSTVDTLVKNILVALLMALVVDVVWQVLTRYALQSPSSFTDELARYIMIWISLLGAAYYSGQNAHISFDVFPDKLSPEKRVILDIVNKSIVLLFALLVLVIGGGFLVTFTFQVQQISSSLKIPMAWIYLIGPLSGLLIVFYKTMDIADLLKKRTQLSSETLH